MSGIFDGMAGLLNDLFGGPVSYLPRAGAPRQIQSIFRARPVVYTDAEGHEILAVGSTWRVPRAEVPELDRGDRITLDDGRVYSILNWAPTGSPAADGFLICELREVAP